jgi:hypothetical protein
MKSMPALQNNGDRKRRYSSQLETPLLDLERVDRRNQTPELRTARLEVRSSCISKLADLNQPTDHGIVEGSTLDPRVQSLNVLIEPQRRGDLRVRVP